jgi:hypothetical protein
LKRALLASRVPFARSVAISMTPAGLRDCQSGNESPGLLSQAGRDSGEKIS